ncbi:hypothetical protein DFH08DRAFT_805951 [Mycena albidolilacea]|uniref:Uncharacterized protein n=1 Tax=Mycena albidolilacea TaxID=1033008 RepID=A0AAD7A798_9AGAR|nr:hypothetical protein DFH08DRAFT_805951 [Mycena albidolilacea]
MVQSMNAKMEMQEMLVIAIKQVLPIKGEVVFGGHMEGSTKIEVTVLKDVPVDDSFTEGLVPLYTSDSIADLEALGNREIFGPFFPIVPVDNIDAIEFVRNQEHPLIMYVFTKDSKLKQQIKGHPLGGVGQSGYGRQISKYTFDPFSYEQVSIDVSSEMEQFNAV